jgi:fumigallin biosynthesis monooxygenase-like protein
MLEKRGTKASDLRKRAAALEESRARPLAAPPVSRPRTTLRAPLPYVLDRGVLYACPTKRSACINPVVGRKNFDGKPWVHDSYRQFFILARDKAFDLAPWYQPIVAIKTVPEKPRLGDVEFDLWWELESPKTCPPFNRRMKDSEGEVGIWHETYCVGTGEYEAICRAMPPCQSRQPCLLTSSKTARGSD